MNETAKPSLETGVEVIKSHLRTLPEKPGVYRMLGEEGAFLYVGKAKSLKKRVASYLRVEAMPFRLQHMIALTRKMEFVVTHTEAEALLLESNLIKKHRPRFNVLMRDDKSFPYILITENHAFPMIKKHRGAKKEKGEYFGPFANAGDVNRTTTALQKIFMLRNCSDSYFAQRTRPCLQYHIKRCSAPCVDYISQEDYADQVERAREFLHGNSAAIRKNLTSAMQNASMAEDYETAAALRDRIQALTAVQARQDINVEGLPDLDILAIAKNQGRSCVQVFFFRGGRNYGNRSYYPRHAAEETESEILAAFTGQFYENKTVPPLILLTHDIADRTLLEEALTSRCDYKVSIATPLRGQRKRLTDFALNNARLALERHLRETANESAALEDVAKVLDLPKIPERIEVFDNSHISGTNMVGAMIVSGPEGFQKSAYRKFNMRTAQAADDYGMMQEMLRRRFAGSLRKKAGEVAEDLPDLILIDGGQAQFNAASEVIKACSLSESVVIVAIAKGPNRNAGQETFFMAGKKPFRLPHNSAALHYLQRLRDEAHRFAVGAHRTRRSRQIASSPFDEIPGIGAARKKALLLHFGSAKAAAAAGIDDLAQVPGISRSVAQKIYDFFH